MNLDFNPEGNNTSEGDDLEQILIQKMSAYTIHNLKDISAVVEIYEDLGREMVYPKKEDFQGL